MSTETTSQSPAQNEGAAAAPDGPLAFTPKAVEMVKVSREHEGLDDSHGLRVGVRGGGCSGFEYALDFTPEGRDNDWVIEYDGLEVYVDPVSARYLQGTTVDYVMGMSGAGFKFQNPKAVGSCGCGHSFAV